MARDDAVLLDVTGVTGELTKRQTRKGAPFVYALVKDRRGKAIRVNWWDVAEAPEAGVRVHVRGRLDTYNGRRQLHADATEPVFSGHPEDPLVARVGYYRDCLRAESFAAVRLRAHDPGHLLVSAPVAGPFHGGLTLPEAPGLEAWLRARRRAGGEPLTVGWPLVQGVERAVGGAVEQFSPLLVGSGRLVREADRVDLESAGVEVNPVALELLGLSAPEADALIAGLQKSIDVDETVTLRGRIAAIFALLERAGVVGLDRCTPDAMSGGQVAPGIWDRAGVAVGDAGAGASRAAIAELTRLLLRPSGLRRGPLAAVLGRLAVPARSPVMPLPTVLPSTVRQDEAVSCACQDLLTVVTGPPGTGKSQVLGNVAAAALYRGDTVLLASKNNQAVDVVVDRLRRGTSSVVVRTGNAERRAQAATRLHEELRAERALGDLRQPQRDWETLEAELRGVVKPLAERVRLEHEVAEIRQQLGRVAARWAETPGCMPVEGGTSFPAPERVESLVREATGCLAEFRVRPGWFWRRRRHRRRVARARALLNRVATATGVPSAVVEACLEAVASDPVASDQPELRWRALSPDLVLRAHAARAATELPLLERQLAQLPQKFEIDDALVRLAPRRTAVGKALLEAIWAKLWRLQPDARAAGRQWADLLQKKGMKGAVSWARRIVRDALPAVPLWAVTNLSVGSSLPLSRGMFDLVVIDEASQCDVASALPLLYRAKRALIVGDPHQLPHVTNLGAVRERRIAERWGLVGEDAGRWDYNVQSLFGVAAAAVPEPPVVLDLHFRSHPAVSAFVADAVYGGELELCWSGEPLSDGPAIDWLDVRGGAQPGRAGRSLQNAEEARRVVDEVRRTVEALGSGRGIGVVAPYRAQVLAVQQLLARELGSSVAGEVTVGTAHTFQGGECDVLYFSTVVDAGLKPSQLAFAADPNLVNVAVTRACRRLVVVGNQEVCLGSATILAKLAAYVRGLRQGGYDSGLELQLSNALVAEGLLARTGITVGGYRLDLAVESGPVRLNVECDGAPFHVDRERDAVRDRAIRDAGWEVLRFSGREISRDPAVCAGQVVRLVDRLAGPSA